jgi:hypothetical protein
MNKLLLLVLTLPFTEYGFSQELNRAHYLRKFDVFSTAGKLHYYELMYLNGDEVALTTIKVFGEIGNPITTTFIIDTCYQQIGKVDSLFSGYLIRDNHKRVFKIKKMGTRKLNVDFNGFIASYKRISETVYLVTKLKNICSCCNVSNW